MIETIPRGQTKTQVWVVENGQKRTKLASTDSQIDNAFIDC